MSSNIINVLTQDMQNMEKKQFNETKRLVQKWKRTKLLEGIESEREQHQMSLLLENQAKQLIREISKTGGQGAEEWSGVALPLVRRIFSSIAAKDFVSVQPMNLPSGLVFYVDFKYGTDQPGFTTTAGATLQENTVHGVTSKLDTDAYEGLYGAGRFGYSSNDYSVTGSAVSGSIVTPVLQADVNYNDIYTGSLSSYTKVTFDLAGLTPDSNGVRAFFISATEIDGYVAEFTKPIDENGDKSTTKVTFIVTPNTPILSDTNFTVKYYKQPIDYTRGDFEAKGDPIQAGDPATLGTEKLDIPELNVELRQEPIVAKSRKLKAVWTPEFAQDLNAYHSIDAELELTSMLSEHIAMEIDLEILDMLISNATTNTIWSARVGEVYDAGSGTFVSQDAQQGRALSYSQNEWFQTMGTQMQKVSNKIHQKTMRGGANFATTSPDVATIIESMPGYTTSTDGTSWGTEGYAMGVQKVGMLNNRFTMYKNPYMKSNLMLMGFRGSAFLETGAVYSPYIPMIMTPVLYDTDNFTPRKGVMTRYAKKITRPEFYGTITVAKLQTV